MGITIHYSATISHVSLIPQLSEEVADICKSANWEYHIIKEPNPHSINGIHFTPPGCDYVFLTFLPDGRMCSIAHLIYKDMIIPNALDPDAFYTSSTHTQDGGPHTHMALIKLFGYLEKKYFSAFQLIDEADYWETNDEELLMKSFQHYDQKMHQVKNMFKHLNQMPFETLKAIEKLLKKKR